VGHVESLQVLFYLPTSSLNDKCSQPLFGPVDHRPPPIYLISSAYEVFHFVHCALHSLLGSAGLADPLGYSAVPCAYSFTVSTSVRSIIFSDQLTVHSTLNARHSICLLSAPFQLSAPPVFFGPASFSYTSVIFTVPSAYSIHQITRELLTGYRHPTSSRWHCVIFFPSLPIIYDYLSILLGFLFVFCISPRLIQPFPPCQRLVYTSKLKNCFLNAWCIVISKYHCPDNVGLFMRV